MLFAIGTRVRFRYTGETGVIMAQLDDGMLLVRLNHDPDMDIPAFEEDLVRDTAAEPISPGAWFVKGKQEPKPTPPPKREIKGQYVILKPKGIQLVFEPMPGKDGNVSRYKAWLINDTVEAFLFELELYKTDATILRAEGKLPDTTALELGDMLYDDLSELPEVDATIWRITTEGQDPPLDRHLKIRPKQFFNNQYTAPVLNILGHHFLLFDTFTPPKAGSKNTDLRDYTQQAIQDRRHVSEPNAVRYRPFDVDEFAHFVPEIDLHIENLTNGYARLDRGEILRIQLQHFQRFLEKAIRLGVPRIFVIHGVGEGRLRDAIAEHLRAQSAVIKFKNEYHAKYGYGATEVIFY